jgi:predicted nucleic acid-binding protein
MILLDTTILVYAVGDPHPLRDPCREVMAAAGEGGLRATTTPEVIQEFVHERARRRTRHDAVRLGAAFAEALSPLLPVNEGHLPAALRLFERYAALAAFDALLAAVALDSDIQSLVSADTSFATVPGLRFVHPATPAMGALLRG